MHVSRRPWVQGASAALIGGQALKELARFLEFKLASLVNFWLEDFSIVIYMEIKRDGALQGGFNHE